MPSRHPPGTQFSICLTLRSAQDFVSSFTSRPLTPPPRYTPALARTGARTMPSESPDT
ncbi:hypothetical protein BDN72DRAFT_845345 [Pluteus cervinus]|uniref:Uncharacterized protein n=1 Tax=Pluteus cervinus TaxID=181527 RepID=A0ACD3AIB1_9AGAR|nr:hypothetical protein BDN72DRAFT_845345 [Pluteus cervinus]